MNSTKAHAGYTLLELMITVILIAVLATMTVGSWSAVIGNARQRALINQYHTFFSFARWQAASTNSLVVICPLGSEGKCVDNWDLPIQVFVDNDRDAQPDGQILKVMNAPGGDFRVRSRTAGSGYFRFADTGMIHGRTGGVVSCSQSAAIGLVYVAINKGGRFRAEYDRDQDGRIMTSSGDAISC